MLPTYNDLKDKIPKHLEAETVFENAGKSIVVEKLKLPNGEKFEYTYFASHTKKSVMILGIDDKGNYIINYEYRYPSRKAIISLPGGCVEGDEDVLIAAKREFYEESGYEASEYHFLGSAYAFPGSHGCKAHFYLAKGLKKISEPKLEQCEVLKTYTLSLDELNEAILSEDLEVDGHLLAALKLKDLKSL